MRILSIFIACFLLASISAQHKTSRYHLKGVISNAVSKKNQKYVSVHLLPYDKKILTDSKGQFKLNVPKGDIILSIDHPPFRKKNVNINVTSDTLIAIELETDSNFRVLDEVEVVAHAPMAHAPLGINHLDASNIRYLPALIGERDILKVLALTAGVSSAAEGTSQIQVRGGTHGQNLFLLDGAPLYSTQHMLGMVSTYNSTIIKSAELYKSGFPAEYGGKLSGVIDVKSNDANTTKLNGEAELGILSTKATLNIPIVKNKLGMNVGGRISNFTIINLINLFTPKDGYKIGLDFADVNSNITWTPSVNDKIRLGMFYSHDGFFSQQNMVEMRSKFQLTNDQLNLNILWFSKINEHLTNRLLIYADNYKFDYYILNKQYDKSSNYQITTAIRSFTFKDKISYTPSEHIELQGGIETNAWGFCPIISQYDTTSNLSPKINFTKQQIQGSVFTEAKCNLKKWNFTTGIRATSMGNYSKVYSSIEPRLNATFQLSSDLMFNASVCRMTQPIHRIANNGLGYPLEIYAPSDNTLKPESSWNFSIGMAKDMNISVLKISYKADLWYKSLYNLTEFKDGHDITMDFLYPLLTFSTTTIPTNEDVHSIVTQGNGNAYGLDYSLSADFQRFKFKMDYTLMQATSQFAELNNGKPFAAPTDMRHTLSTTAEVKLSDTWTFSATWQYHTGRPITVPRNLFPNPYYVPGDEIYNQYLHVIPERNNYRTRDFHRLDIAFSHKYKAFMKYDGLFSLGIYNLYNRANPYLYYIDTQNVNGTPTPVLKSLSIFPILPSVSWSVRF